MVNTNTRFFYDLSVFASLDNKASICEARLEKLQESLDGNWTPENILKEKKLQKITNDFIQKSQNQFVKFTNKYGFNPCHLANTLNSDGIETVIELLQTDTCYLSALKDIRVFAVRGV